MNTNNKMSNYRWVICLLLFLATAVNYMDRQVLSLTWKDFIAPEFHWTDTHYGYITAIFSLVYAIANLFRRPLHRLDGHPQRLPVDHLRLVNRRLHACCLRLAHTVLTGH